MRGRHRATLLAGALPGFRERLIAHEMDRRLLERAVELARVTKEFDWKKLPKRLRVAIDSAPLEGAGRVEDTLNLLAHAAQKVVECAADLLHWPPERVFGEARAPVLLAPSIKASLHRDWSDPAQKASAVRSLVFELETLREWLSANLAEELKKSPLNDEVGTPEDRRVSVEDPEMRHGRKSKTKRFNGFKRHIATDLDSGLGHCWFGAGHGMPRPVDSEGRFIPSHPTPQCPRPASRAAWHVGRYTFPSRVARCT